MDTGITLKLSEDGKTILGSIAIPFDGDEGFNDESEGNRYFMPVKARGSDGKLAVKRQGTKANPLKFPEDFADGYDSLPLIKDGKVDLYVTADGSRLTTEPYTDLSRRNIKSTVVRREQQATSKRTYSTTVKDASIVWPDGKVRAIRFDIKANDPLTPEEFAAKKQATSAKRQATTAQQIVSSDSGILVTALRTKWNAENKPLAAQAMLIKSLGYEVPEDLKPHLTE